MANSAKEASLILSSPTLFGNDMSVVVHPGGLIGPVSRCQTDRSPFESYIFYLQYTTIPVTPIKLNSSKIKEK